MPLAVDFQGGVSSAWSNVITLGLAFSGVLGLALVTHATSRTRRR